MNKVTISIHAPRVGGDAQFVLGSKASIISIHAPRVGGDYVLPLLIWLCLRFQSTPPVWGATFKDYHGPNSNDISIHAPRVGGDLEPLPLIAAFLAISIHAPRVGGDIYDPLEASLILISIHAPRVGGDSKNS